MKKATKIKMKKGFMKCVSHITLLAFLFSNFGIYGTVFAEGISPSPEPTAEFMTESPSPSPTESETYSPSPSPTEFPSLSPTPDASPTVSPSPIPTVTSLPQISETPMPTISLSPTPTFSPSPSQYPTLSPTPSGTPSVSPSPSPLVQNWIAIDIAKMRAHIKEHNLPTIFSTRLDEFEENQKNAIEQNIKPALYFRDAIREAGSSKTPFKVEGMAEQVNKIKATDSIPSLLQKKNKIDPNQNFKIKESAIVSYENGNTNKHFTRKMLADGIVAGSIVYASELPPNGDEFSVNENETTESESIKAKAIELENNPLNILNFVREQIRYTPYYGSKKGAEATLLESEGNDAETASLLIALLRAGDVSGNKKTPARYRHGVVKLTTRDVMDMIGADTPELAARIMGGMKIPYSLAYDPNDTPVYFVVEMFWAEAWMEYGPYAGADQSGLEEKEWVPLVPNLIPTYYFQPMDIIAGLTASGFDLTNFYEQYLEGDFGTATPIDAFESKIATYIATQEGKDMTDAKTVGYRGFNRFEFIPRTLPFSINTDYGIYENLPEELRHTLKVTVKTSSATLLDTTQYMSDIANSEMLVSYNPATTDDATFLASFPTIYDVVPLSLLQLKPILKVNGIAFAGGSASAPAIDAGKNTTLGMAFYSPQRDSSGAINLIESEYEEKPGIAGSTEALAVDTGNVVPPEIRPVEDTSTVSAVRDQKLYRTALNYLDRLEANHDRLAEFTGGTFTDIGTRAVISNSLAVTKSAGVPYSFSWKGLSIDASSKIKYHSRFGTLPSRYQKEFTYLFGLQSSLDESSIFEDDYGVDAVSTVKGLKLINQGVISGEVIKITSANASIIDTMNISSALKTSLYNEVASGLIVYSPKAPFTYGLWTGMVYITLDPVTGSGSYVIGEGLNGGYTIEQFATGWSNFWRSYLVPNLQAFIITPSVGQTFTQNPASSPKINWYVEYVGIGESWSEKIALDVNSYPVGNVTLRTGYGTNQSVRVVVATKPNPLNINTDYLLKTCDGISANCKASNRKSADIKQIVLHFTAGNDKGGSISRFQDPKERVSAHYIVDRDGKIYQIVKDVDQAWHAGCRKKVVKDCVDAYDDTSSIGIEINNYGPLTYSNGKYYNAYGGLFSIAADKQVYTDNSNWRGYTYWEDFYPIQLDALNDLIDVLTDKYAVNKVLYKKNNIINTLDFETDENTLRNFNGIIGHSNIADYKNDAGPALQKRYMELLGL